MKILRILRILRSHWLPQCVIANCFLPIRGNVAACLAIFWIFVMGMAIGVLLADWERRVA